MVARERINLNDLIYPVFVKEGKNLREPIMSMPGLYRYSPDTVLKEIEQAYGYGIRNILLFGIPAEKDDSGLSAYTDGNVVVRAIDNIKRDFPDIKVITDICLCSYTSHGHCGILDSDHNLRDEDLTRKILSYMAVSHAVAGADVVAPSAMVPGQVGAIRKLLNDSGYSDVSIIGYSAKFASNFYGPFRNAADSSFKFDQKRYYQLDYEDIEGVFGKVAEDIEQGADIVMVKPALSYLDVISKVKEKFNYKLAAYNVSGEYAMVKLGALKNVWDEQKMVYEILTAIKRAGADNIITYHAKNVAKWQQERKNSERFVQKV